MRTLNDLNTVTGELVDEGQLDELRETDWAARSERGVEVFRYDQGMQVLDHPDLLKGPSFQYRLDALGIQGEARRYVDMGITNTEGEQRRQMRASMGALFRPAQIAKLRDAIRTSARVLLDGIEAPDDFDLMDYCWNIPARTYCDLVSVPYEKKDMVIRVADSILGTLLKVDHSRREEAEAAILESVDVVREHLDLRRGNLGDDFTSVMIRQQMDGLLTEDQLVAQSFALLQASVDNTAHQMSHVFGNLLQNPDRWQAFIDDRSLRGPIIEETIRLFPRFGTIFRLAARDTVIDDLEISEGTWVFVSVRAGQRDAEAFEDPTVYTTDRKKKRPLMFGAGPYNCLGQNLARMEIEEALDAVADRFPDIRLSGKWERNHHNAVSETRRLHVDLGQEVVPPVAEAAEPEASSVSATEYIESESGHRAASVPPGEQVITGVIHGLVSAGRDSMSLELRAADGSPLPEWEPGSHIDVTLPNGEMRQYSLCGSLEDRRSYRVAVLREEESSGGSSYVHEELRVGDRVEIQGPRNNFVFEPAPTYRFVAGGIGITAILPMAREAARQGADWSLIYLARNAERHALHDELMELPGYRLELMTTEKNGRPSLQQVTGKHSDGALLYACGPTELMNALYESDWPEDAIRIERFAPDTEAINAPKEAFRVNLTESEMALNVPEDKSILDVVEDAGIDWPYSCREGTCGSCETHILRGTADHRDAVLTPSERKENEYMMICVSRAQTDELDLEV